MSSITDNFLATSIESGNPYAIAAAAGTKALELVLPQVGTGRREADIIAPVQNQLNTLLVNVNAEYPTASNERLYQLRDGLNDSWNRFKQWIQSQQWTDGRAAQQAIDPAKDPALTVAATLRNINARLAGGSGSAIPGVQNNTLLYAGGAALAAKLLGFI